jgi:hypothetical protein
MAAQDLGGSDFGDPSSPSLLQPPSMARDIDDDAYVAELLKQDAKKATKTYELVGIDAFNPRRCVTSLRTRHAVA